MQQVINNGSISSVSKLIRFLKLSLPISAHSMLTSSKVMIDLFMISYLGEYSIAAVGLVGLIYFIINNVMSGGNQAVTIMISRLMGAKSDNKVIIALYQSMTLMFILATLMAFSLFCLSPLIISVSVSSADVELIALSYLNIILLAFLVRVPLNCYKSFFSSMKHTQIVMWISLTGVVCNTCLNWILIFGKYGVPAMGVDGAAYATLLSIIIELVIITFLFSYKYKHFLSLVSFNFNTFSQSRIYIDFIKISTPIMLSGILWSVGLYFYHAIYGNLGAIELAIMAMMEPITLMTFALCWGAAVGCSVLIGYDLGAGDHDLAMAKAKSLTVVSVLLASVSALLVWFCQDLIFGLYGGVQESTIEEAKSVLLVVLICICIRSLCVLVTFGVLHTSGDSKFVIKIDFICQWMVGIPLAFFFAFILDLSLLWVYLSVLIEESLRAFLALNRMFSAKWISSDVE